MFLTFVIRHIIRNHTRNTCLIISTLHSIYILLYSSNHVNVFKNIYVTTHRYHIVIIGCKNIIILLNVQQRYSPESRAAFPGRSRVLHFLVSELVSRAQQLFEYNILYAYADATDDRLYYRIQTGLTHRVPGSTLPPKKFTSPNMQWVFIFIFFLFLFSKSTDTSVPRNTKGTFFFSFSCVSNPPHSAHRSAF